MSYRILVTGGAGYLGSIMVPELLKAGHQVTVLDNFIYRQNSLAHVCAEPGFRIVRGDVRDEGLVKTLSAQADAVIPLAALVGAPLCAADPVGAETINKDSVLKLLKNLSPSQMIIMPTTNSAYGSGDKDNFCTEESPLNPISRYAVDKAAVEKELLGHPGAISFRLATVFGMSPRMRIDLLVNDFTYRAVVDRCVTLFEGHFKRNYIHVRDVARVFLHALENFQTLRGQIYNVGLSEANLSKLELCRRIQKHLPDFTFLEAPLGRDPDQRNYIVSNEKIERTGFKTAYDLDFGLQELIKGYAMIRNVRYGNML